MSRAQIALLCSAIAVAGLAAPVAADAQNGVITDPNSPAGVEYAIPLERARGEATGKPDGSVGNQPLFGAGIAPAGEAPEPSAGSDGGSGGEQGNPGSSDSKRDRGERSAAESGGGNGGSTAGIRAAAADGGSGIGLTLAIVIAVVATGLLAGVALRRGLRDD